MSSISDRLFYRIKFWKGVWKLLFFVHYLQENSVFIEHSAAVKASHTVACCKLQGYVGTCLLILGFNALHILMLCQLYIRCMWSNHKCDTRWLQPAQIYGGLWNSLWIAENFVLVLMNMRSFCFSMLPNTTWTSRLCVHHFSCALYRGRDSAAGNHNHHVCFNAPPDVLLT